MKQYKIRKGKRIQDVFPEHPINTYRNSESAPIKEDKPLTDKEKIFAIKGIIALLFSFLMFWFICKILPMLAIPILVLIIMGFIASNAVYKNNMGHNSVVE